MPASHFDVKPMTARPKFIVRHSTSFIPQCKYINKYMHNYIIYKICSKYGGQKILNDQILAYQKMSM
jgi:hypothetical protein